MMGRHPFSGIYLDAGDMPIEKAIQGGRFAYSPDVQRTRMRPPPNTLPISILDTNLLGLFERAFRSAGRAQTVERPSATEWKQALKSFLTDLSTCKVDVKHVFPKHAGSCPWCSLLGKIGVFFFLPGTPTGLGRGQFDLLAIWSQIESIHCPSDTYTRPNPMRPLANAPTPVPAHIPAPTPRPKLEPLPAQPKGLDRFFDTIAAFGVVIGVVLLPVAPPIGLACLAGFGGWLLVLVATQKQRTKVLLDSHQAEVRRINTLNDHLERLWQCENVEWYREYKQRKKTLEHIESQLVDQESRLLEMCRSAKATFETILTNLRSNKEGYERTKETYTRDLTDLTKRSAQIQLDRHLDGHLIRAARIQAMTTARILSLGSFGIETALDVEKLRTQKVPGIGPVLTQRLTEWRESLIRSFKPQPGVPSAERATVDQRYLPRLYQLESVLLDGPRQLREVASQHESRRKNALAQIQESVDCWVGARGGLEVMDRLVA